MALLNLSVLGARGDSCLLAAHTFYTCTNVQTRTQGRLYVERPKATRKRWKVLGVFSPKFPLFLVGFDFFFCCCLKEG